MRHLQAEGGAALTDDEPGARPPPRTGSDTRGAAGTPRDAIQHNERVPAPPESEESATSPAASGASAPTGARRRTVLLLAVAVVVLTLDVVSKVIVVATLSGHAPVRVLGGLIYLVETRNTGAAFNLAEGATVLLTVIAAAVIVTIVRIASRLRSRWWAVALGLVLGGAAGNLSDRLFREPGPLRGAVVDWISLLDPNAPGWHWPVFNIADASIVCGGLIAVALMLLGYDVSGEWQRHGQE